MTKAKRPGGSVSRQTIVETELLRIYDTYGELTPVTIVEEATPVDAVLHPFFTWDDAQAAHEHRLDQARGLIRSVKITVTRQVETDREVYLKLRSWVSTSRAGMERPGYAPILEVHQDPVSKEILLRSMRREIQSMTSRYGDLVEFWAFLDEQIAKRPAPKKGRKTG